MSHRAGLASLLAAVLSWVPATGSECVKLSPKTVVEEPSNELIFSGKVVAATRTAHLGYRATFDVERVWKGPVGKRFDLYVWELAAEVPICKRRRNRSRSPSVSLIRSTGRGAP